MSSKFGLNPWVTIWTQPRKTIRAIVENNPRYRFFYLSTIYALQILLFLGFVIRLGYEYNLITFLIVSLIVAPFFGAIILYINSWIMHLCGKLFKGSAPFIYVRAALSWSKVPNIIPVLMWFIILIFSSHIFLDKLQKPTIIFIDLIIIISAIWSFVILLKNIQEIQKFSIWRALGNVLLAYVISYALLYIFNKSLSYLLIFFER